MKGGPDDPDDLRRIFEEIAEWLLEESGIELTLDDQSFHRWNRRGHPTTQGRIAYQGPNPQPTPPKLKLDITTDELLVEPPELRPIGHPYSDAPLPVDAVLCYSLTEWFGEKLRAVAERCRPRDLYDVVHMHRAPDLIGMSQAVNTVLAHKCSHAEIDVPTIESSARRRSERRSKPNGKTCSATNSPGHFHPSPTSGQPSTMSSAGSGTLRIVELSRASLGTLDPDREGHHVVEARRASRVAPLCRSQPAEGRHRLPSRDGRLGSRRVEPYSLRYTKKAT